MTTEPGTAPPGSIHEQPNCDVIKIGSSVEELLRSTLFHENVPAGWSNSGLAQVNEWEHQLRDDTPREEAKAALWELAANLFVATILEGMAPSEAADMIITDSTYASRRREFIEWCECIPYPTRGDISTNLALPELAAATSVRDLVNEAVMLVDETHRALISIRNASHAKSKVRIDQQLEPFWFLSAPWLPDIMVRGMLASHRSYAMAAVFNGLLTMHGYQHPLAATAVELWAREQRRYLVLLASLPDSNVPCQTVPLDERFNLTLEIEQHEALLEKLNAILVEGTQQ